MARIEITENELLDAIAAAAPLGRKGPADARTAQEISASAGMSIWAVRKALAVLQRAGRLTVHQVNRPCIAGVNRAVPAYTITSVKKRRG